MSRSTHATRAIGLLRSVADPRGWAHVLRLVHYYNYSHVRPRRSLQMGIGAVIAPNVSFRHAHRITIGARSNIGGGSYLWAGDSVGRIIIGDDVLIGPEVFLTASNYKMTAGVPFTEQGSREGDVLVGDGAWLGARVIVLAGVHIGEGCVVGAASVVTKSLPANAIAVGCPARTVASR